MNWSLARNDAAHSRRIVGRGTGESVWRASSALARLQFLDVSRFAAAYRRIWLISPHPDDEVLALGGLLMRMSEREVDVRVVSVTDGAASHPGSRHWTEERLASARPRELLAALDALQVDVPVYRLHVPDGRVRDRVRMLVSFLDERATARDLIVTTWRFDGHPDHEACASAAFAGARQSGAALAEYPVWMWHWATPDDALVPWHRARKAAVDEGALARKREAIRSFASQITPDDGRAPVLPAAVLERFTRPYELLFV
jgi:LmbE family N-acetylglucosaminyl deacetylase